MLFYVAGPPLSRRKFLKKRFSCKIYFPSHCPVSEAAVESPESLNDYLRVTSPGVWLVMAAVIVLLIGGILWGIFGHIRTTANFAVAVSAEKNVCYVTYGQIDKVMDRGVIHIQGADYPLRTDAEIPMEFITEDVFPPASCWPAS